MKYIAPDKALFSNRKVPIFFLFLHENICCEYSFEVPQFILFLHENIGCEYSFEVPQWGTSNEYSHHMFSWRNKKYIYVDTALVSNNRSMLKTLVSNMNKKSVILVGFLILPCGFFVTHQGKLKSFVIHIWSCLEFLYTSTFRWN